MLTLLCTALVLMVELDISLEDVLLTAELARVVLDAALMPLLTLLRVAVADVAEVEDAAAASEAMEARVPLSIGAPA